MKKLEKVKSQRPKPSHLVIHGLALASRLYRDNAVEFLWRRCSLGGTPSVLRSCTICPIKSWAVALLYMFICRMYIILLDFSLFVTLLWRFGTARRWEHEPSFFPTDQDPASFWQSSLCARVRHIFNTRCFWFTLCTWSNGLELLFALSWFSPEKSWLIVFSGSVRMANFCFLELANVTTTLSSLPFYREKVRIPYFENEPGRDW